jgi:hypothetical protein
LNESAVFGVMTGALLLHQLSLCSDWWLVHYYWTSHHCVQWWLKHYYCMYHQTAHSKQF